MKLKKYSLLVLLAGFAMIATFILLAVESGGGVVHPLEYPNQPGFSQAIIWFELLQSPEEVKQVIGEPSTDEGIRLRHVMDTINKYDFLYMVCYPLLFAALVVFVHALLVNKGYQMSHGRTLVFIGLFLSAVMFVGDVLENIQLLKISAYSNLSDIKPNLLTTLQIATRIKSVPIFLVSLLLAYFYILYFGLSFSVILPIVYCSSAILGLIGISFGSARFLVETSYSLLALVWFLSIIHGGVWYLRSKKARAP